MSVHSLCVTSPSLFGPCSVRNPPLQLSRCSGNSKEKLPLLSSLRRNCCSSRVYSDGSGSRSRTHGTGREEGSCFAFLRSREQRFSQSSFGQRELFLAAVSLVSPCSRFIKPSSTVFCQTPRKEAEYVGRVDACPRCSPSSSCSWCTVSASRSSESIQVPEQREHASSSDSLPCPTLATGDGTGGCLRQIREVPRNDLRERVTLFSRCLAKALAAVVIFAALGFGPTWTSQKALATPQMTSSSARKNASEKTPSKREVEGHATDEVEETGGEETEEMRQEAERERLEREQKIRSALHVDQKLKELEAFGRVAGRRPAQQSVFYGKVREAIRKIRVEGRQMTGLRLKELESLNSQLKREQVVIGNRAKNILVEYEIAKKNLQKLNAEGDDKWQEEEALTRAVADAEAEFIKLWQSILDLQAEMLKNRLKVGQMVLWDLPRVQDHCEAEFDDVYQQWLRRESANATSKAEGTVPEKIIEDLEKIANTVREQTLLPLAVGIEEQEQRKVEIDAETQELLDKIKEEQEKGKELRNLYENLVRQRLGKGGGNDELTQIKPAAEDVLRGFPLPELNIDDSFQEDTNLPLMPGLEGALGWKAWRKETKDEFKQYLLDNPDIGRQYVAEKQEEILVARDRVMAKTWYNEKRARWEMDPLAASHAVTKKLVGKARIRHDHAIMYLTMKGDEREYVVDIGAVDAVLEEAGGFDTLFINMITSGVRTSTEFMWIPFDEWPVWNLFQLPFKMVWWMLEDVWNSPLLRTVRPWYFKTLSDAFEEMMIRFGFPLVHRLVPKQIQVALGFDLPEGAEVAEPTDLMVWQQEGQKKVDARYGEGTGSPAWWISLPVRTYVVGMPLLFLLQFVVRFVLAPIRPRKLAMNEVQWKEKKQEQLEKEINADTKKDIIDPIKNVFDNMKRVKRPEVRLKDFAGIDSVKEEINEVISFLRNPKFFKEMGARPPRGVLIVGEPGTGKSTLALAIAAEARVPMIELQGAELEGGAWVGQGASNVRELFKTARELAPLIIYMDDFDHFAGVRGATSDTRKQDHESLINQLLVELDGFETQEGVVLIATTSRPWAIDEALRRPGRMDRTIQLPMPNRREREQILQKVAQDSMDSRLVNVVDWADVADKTAGLTPAQLKYVPKALEENAVGYKIADDEELSSILGWLATFSSITPKWIKNSKLVKGWNERLINWLDLGVTKEDMDAAVEYMDVFGQTQPGIELRDPDVVWTREYKFPHAVWAAGRGLIALLLPDFDSVDLIWLDPTSWEGIAFTKLTKRLEGGYQETGTMTRSYFEKSLVLCFGPYIAARLLLPFGENNNLCRFEIENAEEIAARMVLEFGWGPDDSPLIYSTEESSSALAMGDDHEYELEAKIRQLYDTACQKAGEMLMKNQQVLDALVEHLLEFDCLTKEEMARILEENGAVFEEEPFMLMPYAHAEVMNGSTNGTTRPSKALPARASV
ncbi:unnamed protein product [Sphagnum jensenii]|uniref:AAA+ ATPase domain-containing protein n=1 Tax=Sphagnum jensenii TaxID=128206 RepID=A0ABP1BQC5_9BRYO